MSLTKKRGKSDVKAGDLNRGGKSLLEKLCEISGKTIEYL